MIQKDIPKHTACNETRKLRPANFLTKKQLDIADGKDARLKWEIDLPDAATRTIEHGFVAGELVVMYIILCPKLELFFSFGSSCRIAAVISPFSCVVAKRLARRQTESAHAGQLNDYSALLHGNRVPDKVLDYDERTLKRYEVVDEIVDLEKKEFEYWLCSR